MPDVDPARQPSILIRKARPEDGPTLLDLIRDLAEYERLEPPDAEARTRLFEDMFGPQPRVEAYLAEIDGEAVGYAIVLETYSSFLARPTLYLEDLFVRSDRRRRGAGSALLRFLAVEAVARGCGRMEWVVLTWNELARGVYRNFGAEELDGWRVCRLSGEALAALAANIHRKDAEGAERMQNGNLTGNAN
jgi:GNAT superfamily N-acetyltransferase